MASIDKSISKEPNEKYNGVDFVNICTTYKNYADIVVHCRVKDEVEPDTSDTIALVMLGDIKEERTICSAQIEPPQGSETLWSCTFSASSLPKEEEEYYHFLYISNKSGIRGISSVFSFTSPWSDEKFVEEGEDDDGMVVVTSKVAFFQRKITQLEENADNLKETRDELLVTQTALYSQLTERLQEKAQLQEELTQLRLDSKHKLAELTMALQEKDQMIGALEKEQTNFQQEKSRVLDMYQSDVSRLKEKVLKWSNKALELKSELLKKDKEIEILQHALNKERNSVAEEKKKHKKELSERLAQASELCLKFETEKGDLVKQLQQKVEEADEVAATLEKFRFQHTVERASLDKMLLQGQEDMEDLATTLCNVESFHEKEKAERLKELQQRQEEIIDLSTTLEAIQTQHEKEKAESKKELLLLQKKSEDLAKTLHAVHSEQEKKKAAFEAAMLQRQDDVEDLTKTLCSVESQHEKEMAEARDALLQKEKEMEDLNKVLHAIHSQYEMEKAELDKRLQQKQKDVEDLGEVLNDAVSQCEKDKQDAVKNMQYICECLENDLKLLMEEKIQLLNQGKEKEKNSEELEKELESMRLRFERERQCFLSELEQLAHQNEVLLQEKSRQKEDMQKVKEGQKNLESESQQVAQEVETLKSKLAHCQQVRSDLENELQRQCTQVEEYYAISQNSQQEIVDLTKQLSEREEELRALGLGLGFIQSFLEKEMADREQIEEVEKGKEEEDETGNFLAHVSESGVEEMMHDDTMSCSSSRSEAFPAEIERLYSFVGKLIKGKKSKERQIGKMKKAYAKSVLKIMKERDEAVRQNELMMREIDEAVLVKDKAVGERGEAMRDKEWAVQERDKAVHEKDQAVQERDWYQGQFHCLQNEVDSYKTNVIESQTRETHVKKDMYTLQTALEQCRNCNEALTAAKQQLGIQVCQQTAALEEAKHALNSARGELANTADMFEASQAMNTRLTEEIRAFEQTQSSISDKLIKYEDALRELRVRLALAGDAYCKVEKKNQHLEKKLQKYRTLLRNGEQSGTVAPTLFRSASDHLVTQNFSTSPYSCCRDQDGPSPDAERSQDLLVDLDAECGSLTQRFAAEAQIPQLQDYIFPTTECPVTVHYTFPQQPDLPLLLTHSELSQEKK